jgi:hypothetical protein
MTNTGAGKTVYQVLRSYIPIEDILVLKDLAPFAIGSFLAIYAFLLITDGYYFLIFMVLGFSLGAFYFNNKDGNLKIEQYERNLSYTEQALEQVCFFLISLCSTNTYYVSSSVIASNHQNK